MRTARKMPRKEGAAVPDPVPVLISEVGPRDGLQSVAHTMPQMAKPREQMIEEIRHIVALRDERAPGASGNVVTEDLVFMFEAMGIATGLDLARLVAAREPLKAGLPGEPLHGMTPEAGLPTGFVQGGVHA
jgi:hypothetical protein